MFFLVFSHAFSSARSRTELYILLGSDCLRVVMNVIMTRPDMMILNMLGNEVYVQHRKVYTVYYQWK